MLENYGRNYGIYNLYKFQYCYKIYSSLVIGLDRELNLLTTCENKSFTLDV